MKIINLPPWMDFKEVLNLALPMAGSRLLQMLSGFIGMLFLAHLGPSVLAASTLITATQIMVIVVFMSLLFSLSVVVGKAYGAHQYYEIGTIIQQGCILGFFLSIILVVVFLNIDRFLSLMGQIPELVRINKEYFHAMAYGAPGFVLLEALQQACYGMFKQRNVVIRNGICLIVFIPTAYIFIYGKCGVPTMGVAGLAYAFGIQCYLNLLLLISCFAFQEQFASLRLFSRRKQNGGYLKTLFEVGFPMSIQFGGELLGFFIISIMIGWLGEIPLAAAQVSQQALFLFLVPMFGVAEAAGIFVSQAVGSQRYEDMERKTRACLCLVTVLTLLFALIFIAFPSLMTSLYLNVNDSKNYQLIRLIDVLYIMMSFSLIFDIWRHTLANALRGLYDTRFAMWVGIIIIWLISVPIGYLLGITWGWGVMGFRLATTLAFLVGALAIYLRWKQYLKEFTHLQKVV